VTSAIAFFEKFLPEICDGVVVVMIELIDPFRILSLYHVCHLVCCSMPVLCFSVICKTYDHVQCYVNVAAIGLSGWIVFHY